MTDDDTRLVLSELRASVAEMRAGQAEIRLAVAETNRLLHTVIDALADFRQEYQSHTHGGD